MTDGLMVACLVGAVFILGLSLGFKAQKKSIADHCDKYQVFYIEEVGYKCEILTKKGE